MRHHRKVCLVSLGRPNEGEERRRQSWRRALLASDVEVSEISLLDHPRRPGSGLTTRPFVPESMLWSESSLMSELSRQRPDAVVVMTVRCWTPRLLDLDARVIFDFVDRLSVNYRIRRAHTGAGRSLLFDYLSARHAKAEHELDLLADEVALVYAGRTEAERYGGTWFPNLVPVAEPVLRPQSSADLLFFGTLYNPLNLDALEAMSRHSQGVLRNRSVVIAGRSPTKAVVNMAHDNNWTLVRDFPSVQWLAQLAKVSVAPMGPVTGIQNKVIESCAVGMPVVASESARGGLAAASPLVPGLNQDEVVTLAAELASKPERVRRSVGLDGAIHARNTYSAMAWGDTVDQLLSGGTRPAAVKTSPVTAASSTIQGRLLTA